MFIKKNFNIKDKTTFKIGGRVKYYIEPKNVEELICAKNIAKKENIKYIILGGGANMLFPDYNLNAVVISTKKLNKFFVCGDYVEIGAGVDVTKAIKKLMNRGYSSFEFAAGLPGTIGGAVYMNARCYGKEFSDVLISVRVLTENNKVIELTKDEIGYAYKSSIFMNNPEYIILDATFKIEKKDKNVIKKCFMENYKDRKEKGQYAYPSAGCIFKNNYSIGISTGKIIDQLGLKGYRIGGAEIYDKHANFIINKKNATSKDVKDLIYFIKQKVLQEKGFIIEEEVRIIEGDSY